MILDLNKARIFIRPGNTDLRKVVNGLSGIVEQQMVEEVFSGNQYILQSPAETVEGDMVGQKWILAKPETA